MKQNPVSYLAFILLLLFCVPCRAQNTIDYSKGGIASPLRALSFDKPDSLVIILPKGTSVNWVSYLKISGKQSLKELVNQQIIDDSIIRIKYPYRANQVDNRRIVVSGASREKYGYSHFDNIPARNIAQRNDTTFIIYFKYHPNYSQKEALLRVTYFDGEGHYKIRKPYVENKPTT